MLFYDSNDDSVIFSCDFDNLDLNAVCLQDSFPMESKMIGWSLLYSAVQAYAVITGSKANLSHSIILRCSCYDKPIWIKKSQKSLLEFL